MKKIALFAITLCCILLCTSQFAWAAEEEASSMVDLSPQLDAIGSEELDRALPDEARDLMEQNDIDGVDIVQIRALTPGKLLATVYEGIKSQLTKPFRTLAVLLAIIIIAAYFDGLKTADLGNTMAPVFNIVTTLCVSAALISPIVECITLTATAIAACANFVLTFIPVFCGVVMVSGQPLTAGTFSLFLFGTCQVISQIMSHLLVPMMGVYLAFCIFGSVVPNMKIGNAAKAVKSLVSWSLGIMLSAFVGLLSVQGIVSSSGDTAVVKATKFAIGSFVPVVGSALSDAFMAAQGSLKLLKASLGAYGIIAAVFTFLPVFLQVCIWYVGIGGVGAVSEMFGLEHASQLLKAISTTLGMLMAVIIAFALLIVVSTSMMLVFGQGG